MRLAAFEQVEEEWKRLTEPASKAEQANPSGALQASANSALPQSERAAETPSADGQAEAMDTDQPTPPGTTAAVPEPQLSPEETKSRSESRRLASVMRGEISVQLYLEFLHSHNHADLQVQVPP